MRMPGRSKGVRSSLEEVFVQEESPLLRYAYGLLGRRELAEEVVQDAFLKLHEHLEEVENSRAWLFRCVRNLSLNLIRKNQREVVDEAADERPSLREQPDDELERMEAVGMLQMLVSDMEEEDRDLVRLKYFKDRSYQEIAEELQMSVSNVGYRLHHLLKGLAESLRKSGIEGGQR